MAEAEVPNYESGTDFTLEFGEYRFSFNQRDFSQRVEQAAVNVGFVAPGLRDEELEDLVMLAVFGEVKEPISGLGIHVNAYWTDLAGSSDKSLVYWLRRLVFRSAWLDQKVKDGELDVVFDGDARTFKYVNTNRRADVSELKPAPSWQKVAYRRA